MFSIVADIKKYPDFLPLCESLVITSSERKEKETELIATMGIGYKSFREKFTTKVHLQPHLHKISVSHIEGPFRYLENSWFFQAQGPHRTDVHFELAYEFQSSLLSLVMGAVFDRVFRHFADTFEQRAHTVYGSTTENS